MKNWKRIYCICASLLTMVFIGCSDESEVDVPQANDNKAELTLSVNIPEALSAASRSFSNPQINSLYLVVFDNLGYLAETVRATPVNEFSVTGETKFKVTLEQTPNKRIIHFIANYDASNLSYGSESEIIGKMKVSGTQDAYWQRVEFPSGISEDNTETAKKLTRIPLVRNFTRISVKVDEELTKFKLTGFAVVNTLNAGTVAPYNTNGGEFPKFVDDEQLCRTYDNIVTTQRYNGFMPSSAGLENTNPQNVTFGTAPFYMYERKYSNDNTATYVLVKGRYLNGKETFYKLDITYNDNSGLSHYYNLLRNFEYAITITDVQGNGYDTASEAGEQPASNNLSGSVLTKSLLNISDGTSRLFVNFTDTTLVNTNPIELKYKYIPNINSPTNITNGSVKTDLIKAGKVIESSTATSDEENGYRIIKITPNSPTDIPQEQTVTLYVPGGLSREVTFTLRKPQDMTVICPVVRNTSGTSFTLTIQIPDGMLEKLFPLEFLIESSKLSIYPDASAANNKGYMPVKVGTTIVKGQTGSSFAYQKIITYEDYKNLAVANNIRAIECAFKTNIAASASTIYVHNKYFNLGEAELKNN